MYPFYTHRVYIIKGSPTYPNDMLLLVYTLYCENRRKGFFTRKTWRNGESNTIVHNLDSDRRRRDCMCIASKLCSICVCKKDWVEKS